jgi:two-component system phosphate regulon response regulator PhoB|tara:strand:- start:1248 stop:1928 length:681 start_codon:yes stop_codon:yes gene_type:complete
MKGKIFIIEDETSIIQLVQHNLEKEGFVVSSSINGNDGLKELKKFQPNLLLLDWMLPDLSGIDVCKNLRKDNSFKDLPIIMLTAKGEEEDKVKGLESGADDYITKPFSFNELMARIKAVLRRTDPNTVSDNLKFDDLILDRIEKRVYRDKKEIQLGPTEFRLLEFFLSNPKRVFTRDQILESVWPNNINVESRTIDVHIRRLRQSINIKDKKELIRTVRSSGYSLI